MNWRFDHPWLLALLVIPLLTLLWRHRRGGAAFGAYALAVASAPISRGPAIWKLITALGLASLVIAAARPQWGRSFERHEQRGRDLIIVIDLSKSMLVDDMFDSDGDRINRLQAVSDAAERFIDRRPNDRIGLVFFSEQAMTSCPLTFDHDTVIDFLHNTEERQLASWQASLRQRNLRGGGLLGEGTNLGLGIGTALRRLVDVEARSGRAVVLITDGRDTPPEQMRAWKDPVAAAKHANDLDVNLYAIGVGDANGTWTDLTTLVRFGRKKLVPVTGNMLPDMQRLQEITDAASGMAMRAGDREQLEQILDRIDALEPSPYEVEMIHDYHDRFALPLTIGLLLLLSATLLEPRLRGPL